MKKWLVLAFLIGFTPLSSFYSAQAMEESEDDSNCVFKKRKLDENLKNNREDETLLKYVVSPEEDAPPLSIAELRGQFPIDDTTHYGDLDSQLYASLEDGKRFSYNSSEKVADAVTKLELLARNPRGVYFRCEVNPLPHLFLAATSFIEGTNGVSQDRQYGAKIMKNYILITNPKKYSKISINLRKLKKDTNFTIHDFIEAVQERRREDGVDFKSGEVRVPPSFCLIS